MKKILIATMIGTLVGITSHADEVSGNATTSSTADTMASSPQVTMTPTSMSPTDHRFELGAIFGEPTGASLKYWLDDKMAVDGAVGWSFHDDSNLYFHSDVLWHKFDLLEVSKGQFPVYFGVGGLVNFRNNRDDIVGIRAPLGINYLFEDVPVSLFLEVAPVLDVAPAARGDITAGIGARYRF